MNIDWLDPELYYFLTVLAGVAALLAVVYEFPRRKRLPGHHGPNIMYNRNATTTLAVTASETMSVRLYSIARHRENLCPNGGRFSAQST